jgi:hypothetical protein
VLGDEFPEQQVNDLDFLDELFAPLVGVLAEKCQRALVLVRADHFEINEYTVPELQ